MIRARHIAPLAAALFLIAGTSTAAAAVSLTDFSPDPYTNSTSQHRTHVEPDTFAYGSTEVAAYQSGRFYDGGASGIGYATTTDNGSTWTSGTLPGITTFDSPSGSYGRATDAAVAYDAKHGVWLISTLGLTQKGKSGIVGKAVLVSRSTDGGLTFGNPVVVASASRGQNFDKNWIACDNTQTSGGYGNCYVTFDDYGHGDLLKFSRSQNGGTSWSSPVNTADNAKGLGGQPVVKADGTVIVPASNASESAIISTRSANFGQSWQSSTLVSQVVDHTVAANIRSGPLPSAEIDGSGRVYVAWQDCRFETGCAANDIVLSSSTDGVSWSPVTGVPADDAAHPNADQFIPGLGVDPTGHLALTYYYYDDAACSACRLNVGYMSSADGGAHWSSQANLAGPIDPSQIADTSQGRMVGDYISTSFLGSTAWPAFMVTHTPPAGTAFDERGVVPTGGLAATGGSTAAISASAAVVAPQGSPNAALHKVGRRE